MKIIIINGPNLNLLGKREPEIYGVETLEDILMWLEKNIDNEDTKIDWFQSNHEGEIIDCIHNAIGKFDGILINPGAYTHYSYAIRDAISGVGIPTVEVHLSDISNREEFRKISVIESVCIHSVMGMGKEGYLEGIQFLRDYLTSEG